MNIKLLKGCKKTIIYNLLYIVSCILYIVDNNGFTCLYKKRSVC